MREVAAREGIPVLPGGAVVRKGFMGLPAPFVEAALLNEHDEQCLAEEPGQLAFRPKLPALFLAEYLGKPEATLAAFSNLWFHTGDAAFRGSDGYFYFVDRLGDRIRVRGENLSSFQVEDLLNQHPGIRFCAVLPIRGAEGDEDDIVAFVVPDGAALDEDGGARLRGADDAQVHAPGPHQDRRRHPLHAHQQGGEVQATGPDPGRARAAAAGPAADRAVAAMTPPTVAEGGRQS